MFTYETMVLLFLESRGPNYESGISGDLTKLVRQQVSRGGIHYALSGLEKQNLVKRYKKPVPLGRPRIYYSLTPGGRESIRKIRETFKLLSGWATLA